MQESCNSSHPLCICSKNMTTDQLLRHMRQNLQLDHFELAYHSLEPEKGRRLCMTGICRQCRQRLCYQFSTIAFRAMSCDVHHSREYWLRGKRCGRIVQTLNDDQNADDLRDSVTESVDNVIQFEAYTSTLTPLQQRIAELRDIGYSDREISAICGIPYKVVALEMEGAKRSILEVYIGDAPRAA